MQANEFFFLHYTDIALHEIVYLTIQQNMYYDFLFWDYANSVYTQNNLDFGAQTSENIALNFSATAKHIEGHIFESLAINTIVLSVQALNEYEHINVFISQIIEPIDFEHWATLLVTTEPRNYEALGQLVFGLKIVNWVYFESDIYKQTYKIEVDKPDTLWVATEQDKAKGQYVFGRDPITKVDRRILSLTDIDEPIKISYASEIIKPNTLYTKTNTVERGLMDD